MAQHHTALAATAEHSGRSSHLHLPMLPLFPREHSRPLAHYDYKPLAGFAQRATPAACADRSRVVARNGFWRKGREWGRSAGAHADGGGERRRGHGITLRHRRGAQKAALCPHSPSLMRTKRHRLQLTRLVSPLKNFAIFLVPGFLVHSAQYTVYLLHTVEVSQY